MAQGARIQNKVYNCCRLKCQKIPEVKCSCRAKYRNTEPRRNNFLKVVEVQVILKKNRRYRVWGVIKKFIWSRFEIRVYKKFAW